MNAPVLQCFSVLHAPVIRDSSVTPPSLLLQQWVLGSCQQSASFTMRSFPPTDISKCYTVRFRIEDAVQDFMWDWKSMYVSLTINTWIPDESDLPALESWSDFWSVSVICTNISFLYDLWLTCVARKLTDHELFKAVS